VVLLIPDVICPTIKKYIVRSFTMFKKKKAKRGQYSSREFLRLGCKRIKVMEQLEQSILACFLSRRKALHGSFVCHLTISVGFVLYGTPLV